MGRQSSVVMLLLFWCSIVLAATQMPLARDYDRAHAQLAISADGTTVTVRAPAPDALRLCVEPPLGAEGSTRCYTVGQLRRGALR